MNNLENKSPPQAGPCLQPKGGEGGGVVLRIRTITMQYYTVPVPFHVVCHHHKDLVSEVSLVPG